MSAKTALFSLLAAGALASLQAQAQEPQQRLRFSTASLLLEEDVLVDVGFNCPPEAINILLKGVKLIDLEAPTGFRDAISVHASGEVAQSSPRTERVDELAKPKTPISVRPAPAQ